MSQPHVLVADWFEESEFEHDSFDRAGISWSWPACGMPLPSPDEQHRQLLKWISDTPRIDAVLFGAASFDAEVIDALPPTCKLLQRMGIGLDNVDLQKACQRGIVVRNTPEYCVEEVAVHAMAMLLSLHRQLFSTQQVLLSGHWNSITPLPLDRLSALTLGIVGLGRIGQKLANLMRQLTPRIVYYDPAVTNAPDWIEPLALNDLLHQADLVSLHCPMTADNRHIINAQTLALMKPTAILVNVSRSGLIDSESLVMALNTGCLAGAGLDVYEPEVLSANSPLRQCRNVILTSHTAWYSRQSILDARKLAMKNILETIRPNM